MPTMPPSRAFCQFQVFNLVSNQREEQQRTEQGRPVNKNQQMQRDNSRVILNVGGRKFETYRETLTQCPDTLLGMLFSLSSDTQKGSSASAREALPYRLPPPDTEGAYFFDRNPRHFEVILEWYRTGIITVPPSLPFEVLHDELRYWGVDVSLPGGYQWKLFLLGKECKKREKELKRNQLLARENEEKSAREKMVDDEEDEEDEERRAKSNDGEKMDEDEGQDQEVLDEGTDEDPNRVTSRYALVRKIIPLLQDGLRNKVMKKKLIIVKESQSSFELSASELKNGDELIRDSGDYNLLDTEEGKQQVKDILEGAHLNLLQGHRYTAQITNPIDPDQTSSNTNNNAVSSGSGDGALVAFPTSVKKFETKFTSGPRNGEYTGEYYIEFKVVLDKEKIFQPPVHVPTTQEAATQAASDSK